MAGCLDASWLLKCLLKVLDNTRLSLFLLLLFLKDNAALSSGENQPDALSWRGVFSTYFSDHVSYQKSTVMQVTIRVLVDVTLYLLYGHAYEQWRHASLVHKCVLPKTEMFLHSPQSNPANQALQETTTRLWRGARSQWKRDLEEGQLKWWNVRWQMLSHARMSEC